MKHVILAMFLMNLPNLLHAESTRVVTADAQYIAVEKSLTLAGNIKAVQSAQLSALTDGVVSTIYSEAGDVVSSGAVMLSLDAALIDAQVNGANAILAQAQVAATEAKRRYDEAVNISSKRLLAKTEMLSRKTTWEAAKAKLAEAKADKDYLVEISRQHHLKAPFSGVVSRRLVDVGEWVSRGQGVYELVSNEDLWLELMVPQEYLNAIQTGKQVSFTVSGFDEHKHSAEVLAKIPVISPTNRSFILRLSVPSGAGIQAGMAAEAKVPLATQHGSQVVIPGDALLRHPDGGHSVFVVSQGVAMRKNVMVGERINGKIEVLTGLNSGDKVVIEGNELLKDGDRVVVTSIDELGRG